VTKTDVTLLSLLQPSSEVLCRIHDGFLSLLRRRESGHTAIEIASFYETLPILGRAQIVDQSSATIPGFNNISIHADHRDIARFSTAQHPGCKSIVGVLERWARPSETDMGLSAEAEAFLETLSFSEMGVRQAIIEPAESGTCLWISKHPAYKAWVGCQDLDDSHGLLWIKGKPGSGKSTLLKHIASAGPKTKGVVRLVFFFNARGAEEERTAQGLFKTFLHQLVHESPVMRRRLLTSFRKKKSETGRKAVVWNPRELREMFFDTLRFYSKTPVEIFVDALDECKEDEVRAIISAFEKCAADYISKGSQNLKICWSSRHYPHISIGHGFEVRVEAMNLDDIELYVHRHLARSERGDTLRSLGSEIVRKSQGVFLWSVLVVNKICKLADKGLPLMRIEKVLRDLPSKLSKLYAEIFSTLDPELAEDTASLII
jgi:energy-coupling factor transporter ATP-binding protein EcfA2